MNVWRKKGDKLEVEDCLRDLNTRTSALEEAQHHYEMGISIEELENAIEEMAVMLKKGKFSPS